MLQRLNINRLILAVVLTSLSLIFGMAGFTYIEHYGPIEAFYMTVTTVATVGFGELRPFSPALPDVVILAGLPADRSNPHAQTFAKLLREEAVLLKPRA